MPGALCVDDELFLRSLLACRMFSRTIDLTNIWSNTAEASAPGARHLGQVVEEH
jgi:hypothetical protein